MSGVMMSLLSASSSLMVTADDCSGSDSGPGPAGVVTTSNLPNPIVTGGVGPFTYLWEEIGAASGITVSNPNVANPTWSALVNDGEGKVGDFRLTVTDAAGRVGDVTILVSLNWISTS